MKKSPAPSPYIVALKCRSLFISSDAKLILTRSMKASPYPMPMIGSRRRDVFRCADAAMSDSSTAETAAEPSDMSPEMFIGVDLERLAVEFWAREARLQGKQNVSQPAIDGCRL